MLYYKLYSDPAQVVAHGLAAGTDEVEKLRKRELRVLCKRERFCEEEGFECVSSGPDQVPERCPFGKFVLVDPRQLVVCLGNVRHDYASVDIRQCFREGHRG